MIIKCEQCQAKFKIADSKVKKGGIKVRCSKCKNVFQVIPQGTEAAKKENFSEQNKATFTPPSVESNRPESEFEPKFRENGPRAVPSQKGESIDAGDFIFDEILDEQPSLPAAVNDPWAAVPEQGSSLGNRPVPEDLAESMPYAQPLAADTAGPAKMPNDPSLSVDMKRAEEKSAEPSQAGKSLPQVRKINRERQTENSLAAHALAADIPPPTNFFLKYALSLILLLLLPFYIIWLYLYTLGLPFSLANFQQSIKGQLSWRGEEAIIYQLNSVVDGQAGIGSRLDLRGTIYNPNKNSLNNLILAFSFSDKNGQVLDALRLPCCNNIDQQSELKEKILAGESHSFHYLVPLRDPTIAKLKLQFLSEND